MGGGSKGYGGKLESGKVNPYSCVVLAGAREQRQRRDNLEAFKEGEVRFLICTDVAARGIDIAGLPFVIQMTLPDDIENYIHRIGRCGRAQRMGLAVSIVATEKEKVWYHKCPTKGKNCQPSPGNTKLTIPFGVDGKMIDADEANLLVDEGGCTVWYNEPYLVKQVEKRIGQNMGVMDRDDFGVEDVLDSPLEGRAKKKKTDDPMEPASRRGQKRTVDSKPVVYGEKKADTGVAKNAKQMGALTPVALTLASLETEVQQIFANAFWGTFRSDVLRSASTNSREQTESAAAEKVVADATVAMATDEGGALKKASGWAMKEKGKKTRW